MILRHRFTLCSLFLFCCSTRILAQNLITNPGFEQGRKGWNSLWTRTPNAGVANIISGNVHAGDSALHIKHWGAQDWSFGWTNYFPVKTGDIYQISSWVNVKQLKYSSEYSVILYDSSRNVMSWSYGAARFDSSKNGYQKFTSRFIIPSDVRYILPRFIGVDSCDIYIDDVELICVDSTMRKRTCILENNHIRCTINIPSFSFELFNKTNGKNYKTESSFLFQILKIDSTKDSFSFSGLYIPNNFNLTLIFSLRLNDLKIEIQADSASAYTSLMNFPGKIRSALDDYLIIPRTTGMIQSVKEPYPFWEYAMFGYKSTMPFVGVTNLRDGYMIVSDDPWNSAIRFEKTKNDTLYAPQLVHYDSKSVFGHNRTFYYVPVDSNGYIEMCQWYRTHAETLGLAKTFKQKISENPNVDKLRGAVDFWALDGSFQKTLFIDSLIDLGIDRAIISLGGGWYDKKIKSAIIDTINARGLLSSRYDIYTDVWSPTYPQYPWFRTEGYPDDIVVKKNGNLQEGWLAYINNTIPFQGYVACSSTHTRYANKWIPDDLDTNKYNCRFIDVELAATLQECYSLVHPLGRKEDAMDRIKLLDVVKNKFKLVTGSEETRHFAFPVVDFGEGTMSFSPVSNAGYDWITPIDTPDVNFIKYDINPANHIPLHGLVFHDVHVPTWYTGDGVSKVPAYWDDKDLLNILYASMPLFMPPNNSYWQTNREKFLTSYHLISSVSRSCGFEQMIDHKMLNTKWTVQRTDYSNGWKVAVNFDQTPFTYVGKILPPKGFYASDGRHEAYRIIDGNGPVAYAQLDDRIFINPYGKEIIRNGIRTTGSVFLKKYPSYLMIVFEGNQQYIDLKPDQLLLPMNSIHVFVKNSTNEIQLTTLSNGWYRLIKQGNNIFYRIEGDLVHVDNPRSTRNDFKIFPNPVSGKTTVTFSQNERGIVNLILINLLGQTLKTITSEYYDAGEFKFEIDMSDVLSGLYFVKMQNKNRVSVKKIIVTK